MIAVAPVESRTVRTILRTNEVVPVERLQVIVGLTVCPVAAVLLVVVVKSQP